MGSGDAPRESAPNSLPNGERLTSVFLGLLARRPGLWLWSGLLIRPRLTRLTRWTRLTVVVLLCFLVVMVVGEFLRSGAVAFLLKGHRSF